MKTIPVNDSHLLDQIDTLQQVLEMRELDSQMKLSQFVQISNRELVERDLLQQQLKQMEEKNAALTKQFNELFQYSEGLYQDADRKRKLAEKKIEKFDALEKELNEVRAQLKDVSERERHLTARNTVLEEKNQQLTTILEQKQSLSLSTVARGKDCIRSTMRSMNDFYGSFQLYLDSIEKNGVTPISIKTGKLLSESWKVQKENLEKVSASLNQLFDAHEIDMPVSEVTHEKSGNV